MTPLRASLAWELVAHEPIKFSCLENLEATERGSKVVVSERMAQREKQGQREK